MLLAVKNRFLSLFSGYPFIPEAQARLWVDYEDGLGPPRKQPDDNPPDRHPAPPAQPDELVTGRGPHFPEAPPDPWQLAGLHRVAPGGPPDTHHLPTLYSKPGLFDHYSSHGAGGGGGLLQQRQIHIQYGNNSDQIDARIDQVNVLHEGDVVTTDGQPVAWPHLPGPTLADLVHQASTHVPARFVDLEGDPESVAANLREAASSGTGPQTLQPGVTVDGNLVPAEAPLPQPPTGLVAPLPTDHGADIAAIRTGNNILTNEALIYDTQGLIGSLVVMGDSHTSNVIVQTNVLADESQIAGAPAQASLQSGGNEAHNVAQFVDALDSNPYVMGFRAGSNWHVDWIDGDFYDVRFVRQYNDLRDGDLVQQTAADHYKFIDTGSNELGNLTSILSSGTQYDLVVVLGNYYGVNWILQTNVLLNSDYVLVDGDSQGAVTISTGANWASNTATIADYTGGGIHALTGDQANMVGALQGGGDTASGSLAHAVPGDGSGLLNVLFITGDYYNMNVIEQTNIVGDSDVVLQTLKDSEAGYVATGGNHVSNDAVIATLGPLGGQYVAGQTYNEAVLVQTNIVTPEGEQPKTVVTNDPSALAPEAAVFVQHAPEPEAQDQHIAAAPNDAGGSVSSDPLASVLS